jgi:phage tail sheath protein FI
MPEYLSPGVYVEEFEMGGRPVAGVSTSTAGFIGLAERGTTEGVPELVTNFADFQRKFGGYLSENGFGAYRYLAFSVEHFFTNGGSRCYVMRVAPEDAKAATNSHNEGALLQVAAKNPGTWGNNIRIKVLPASKAKTQILEVAGGSAEDTQYVVKNAAGFNNGDVVLFDDGSEKQFRKITIAKDNFITLSDPLNGDVADTGLLPQKTLSTCEFTLQISYYDEAEVYEKLSLNPMASNFVENALSRSNIISVSFPGTAADEVAAPFAAIAGAEAEKGESWIDLRGGSDGAVSDLTAADFNGQDKGPGKRTGIQSFIDNDEVSIMAIPGITDPNVQLALVAHCENLGSRFAVLDVPRESKKVSEVTDHRNIFDSSYAAMYHPWLIVFDPSEKKNIAIPPSGSMAGIYARSDNTRGVHKAPANEPLRNTVGLDCQYNKGEQDILNPKGVNLIRYFTGQGIRVWGSRTVSSNSLWKYVNVRRLFIFLEESIKRGTQWVVFEPNDEKLWARVHRTIDAFLTTVWREGALFGSSPGEAFFIRVDRTTMSQDDIDNGRLICVIGVAPVKPAEFVIFRIAQIVGTPE